MDGRGRWIDNVFIERLWKSVKYEDVYLKAYDSIPAAREGLTTYFEFYNSRRRHQSLARKTLDNVYCSTLPQKQAAIWTGSLSLINRNLVSKKTRPNLHKGFSLSGFAPHICFTPNNGRNWYHNCVKTLRTQEFNNDPQIFPPCPLTHGKCSYVLDYTLNDKPTAQKLHNPEKKELTING